MNSLRALLFLLLCGVALPGSAHEDWAYTSANVHLRAGPARDYPVIAVLPRGFEITVHGCLSDYSWCDVIAGAQRGWIYGAYIYYPYQGHHVPVISYGPSIGIFVIGFVLIDYWDYYYPHYWFYRDRDYWAHRYPPRPPSVHPGERPPPPSPRPPRDDDDRDRDHDHDWDGDRDHRDDDRDRNRDHDEGRLRPGPPPRGEGDAPRLSLPQRDDDAPRLQRPEREPPDSSHRQQPQDEPPRYEQPRDRQPRQEEPREQRAPDSSRDHRDEQRFERRERKDEKRERQDR